MGLYPSTYVNLELVIIRPFYRLVVIRLDCSVQLVDFAIFTSLGFHLSGTTHPVCDFVITVIFIDLRSFHLSGMIRLLSILYLSSAHFYGL